MAVIMCEEMHRATGSAEMAFERLFQGAHAAVKFAADARVAPLIATTLFRDHAISCVMHTAAAAAIALLF